MYPFTKSKKFVAMLSIGLFYLAPANIHASSKNINDHRTTNKQTQKKMQRKTVSIKKFRNHQNNAAVSTQFDEADAIFGKRTQVHAKKTVPDSVSVIAPNNRTQQRVTDSVSVIGPNNRTQQGVTDMKSASSSADREASKPSVREVSK